MDQAKQINIQIFMSTSCEKFTDLRTVSSSKHIIKNHNGSFVNIFWFNFKACFKILTLIGRSEHYNKRSFLHGFSSIFNKYYVLPLLLAPIKMLRCFPCGETPALLSLFLFFGTRISIKFRFFFCNTAYTQS